MGHQLPAHRAAQERGAHVVRLPAQSRSAAADPRRPAHRRPRRDAGDRPGGRAVRRGGLARGDRWAAGDSSRCRHRRQLQRYPQPARGGHLQHRLRGSGGGPAPRQPDPLPALLSRAARLLPGEREHLRIRAAQRGESVLQPAHRARRGAGDPDRVRRAAGGAGGGVRPRLSPGPHGAGGRAAGRTVHRGPRQAELPGPVEHRLHLYAPHDGRVGK